MKKVLLATSALTLLAGAAAAEVNLSGYARLGVNYSAATGATTTYNRLRLNISASTETDGGISMGTFMRIQGTNVSGVATVSPTLSGANVWISNGMATLTVGNAGGAVSSAANIFGCGVGFAGACNDMADNSFANHTTFASTSSGPNTVRLDFALGSANVSLSGGHTSGGGAQNSEIAANFSVGGATIGLGYEAAAASPTTFANVSMDAGSATVGLRYATNAGGNGYIAHVTYAMGPGSLYAYAGNNLAGSQEYGVSYSMSLGGGATAAVALFSTGGSARASAGAQFNF